MDRRVSATRTALLLGRAADRSPAYQGIADALRLLISDGRIAAGTRLPSERELTAALGVSRTTVTRAYEELRDRDYLSSRRGSGHVTRLPVQTGMVDNLLSPGRSADLGADGTAIDLTCAAHVAPVGIAAAYERAVARLPGYFGGTGYFPSGVPELRAAIAARYTERGLPTTAEQVVVTAGALAATAIAVRAFCGPGDRVLVERPTYPNAMATLRRSGARLTGVEVDPDGWDTEVLTAAIAATRPTLAFLIPDFHNPTGLLMPTDQRRRVAAAMRAQRTLVLVDETLAELALDEVEPALPYAALDRSAISIGSASKTFWGGLRVGWLRAPTARVGELISARLTLDLGAALLEQLVAVELLQHRAEVIATRRAELRQARDTLLAGLATALPDWHAVRPVGGLSLWCALPAPRSTALASVAERHGLLLAAGSSFAPDGGLEGYVRIPFARPVDTLTEVPDRLAAAWAETNQPGALRADRGDRAGRAGRAGGAGRPHQPGPSDRTLIA